jgi:hypothetical protein
MTGLDATQTWQLWCLVTDVWGAELWYKSCVAREASEKLGAYGSLLRQSTDSSTSLAASRKANHRAPQVSQCMFLCKLCSLTKVMASACRLERVVLLGGYDRSCQLSSSLCKSLRKQCTLNTVKDSSLQVARFARARASHVLQTC